MPSATAREDILCKHIQKLQREHSSTGSFSFDPELLLVSIHAAASMQCLDNVVARCPFCILYGECVTHRHVTLNSLLNTQSMQPCAPHVHVWIDLKLLQNVVVNF